MSNLWTIYKYEIKKLTGKKLFWVMAFLCVVGISIPKAHVLTLTCFLS